MFNTRQVLNQETQYATVKQYNHQTKTYGEPIRFKYKTFDDTQYREARNQAQTGNITSKYSLSIKTSAPIEINVKDKITLDYDGRTYEVTSAQELQDRNVLVSLIMPNAKGQHTQIVHLNKD